MISRIQINKIKEYKNQYPIISINGPRQSGKTTLSKICFPDYKYYNLEDPNTRDFIVNDPKSFANKDSVGTIFDEVQKYPELLSYIQVAVDESKKNAQFVLTGSENIVLSEKISQSLAGRVVIFNLLPLSIDELKSENLLSQDLSEIIWKGFYPRIYDSRMDPTVYYANYLNTYIERDVRSIRNIGNLSDFQRFMRLLAGRVGQLLNIESLANDLGVDSKTVNSWLSILETTFIVFKLTPYFNNFGKRVIKSPKIYFYDTGLLTYLLNINKSEELEIHFARGSLFENLIIAEVIKYKSNYLALIQPYFWRDSHGNEVDLLIDRGSKIDTIEIKSGKTFKSELTKGLNYWNSLEKSIGGDSYLVYDGELEHKLKNVNVMNWRNLDQLLKTLV